MSTVSYVKGAERMMTSVGLTRSGLRVHFADDQEGVIPYSDLALESAPQAVNLSTPFSIELELVDGQQTEIPWDFARHYADPVYQTSSESAAQRGKAKLGVRIRQLRNEVELSQEKLAERSGINRVTIARIELGEHSPRYATLVAIANGLKVPVERLLVG